MSQKILLCDRQATLQFLPTEYNRLDEMDELWWSDKEPNVDQCWGSMNLLFIFIMTEWDGSNSCKI